MNSLIALVVLLVLSVGFGSSFSNKIDKLLLTTLDTNGIASIIVTFNQSTSDIIRDVNTKSFRSRGLKITHLKSSLEKLTEDSQSNVKLLVKHKGHNFKSFWISNQMFVDNATTELVSALSDFPEVLEIRKEKIIYIDRLIASENENSPGWAMETIKLADAWKCLGGPEKAGDGVVVATIDTGVRCTHESLTENFRSSYGWFDPVQSMPTPIDEHGHGSHIMGTIVGSGGIGVAPAAKWITCRGCLSLECAERNLISCSEWITCPTLSDGKSANCEQAPNIVSISWISNIGDNYTSQLDCWKSAGIIPVLSIGNSGPTCGSMKSPGDSENVIVVGATDAVDNVAYFSSRGPSEYGHVMPSVSAPGQNIRSAWFSGDDVYNTISGTSTATAHVAGLVALLVSKDPSVTYTDIKYALEESGVHCQIFPEAECGGTSNNHLPNNFCGFGRINAATAVAYVGEMC